jgi:hypothetical protein
MGHLLLFHVLPVPARDLILLAVDDLESLPPEPPIKIGSGPFEIGLLRFSDDPWWVES